MENTSLNKSEKGSNGKKVAPLLLKRILAAALAVAVICLFAPLRRSLVISDGRSGETLAVFPIEKGEEFKLCFLHSRNLSPIEDVILWDGEKFICLMTRFKMYGAGVPDISDGIGAELVKNGDWYELRGVNKEDKILNVMLQTVPDHTLIYRDKEYKLAELYGSGTLLSFSVKGASLVDIIRFKMIRRETNGPF